VREVNGLIPTHVLARGELVHLLYELGRTRATGVLTLHVAGRAAEELPVRRGQLMAADTDALARQASRRLTHFASLAGVRYALAPAAGDMSGLEPQLSLAAWARSYLEQQLDPQAAQALVAELTGVKLVLVQAHAPDVSLCDATDRRILEALAQPRRLDQIWHHARTPRFRLLSFLHVLRVLGALEIVPGEGVRVEAPSQPVALAAVAGAARQPELCISDRGC
jgi:hypothetical protein